jgi:hypothetical protein
MTLITGSTERSAMTAAATSGLSDAQLVELLDLVRDADSVELKTTVPASGQRSAIDALGMDPLDAQIRQVFFFDTPDLALDDAGLVVRARRIQGRGADSVVKLRPVQPGDLPARVRRSPGFTVEVDAMPGGFVCSGTMKGTTGTAAVTACAAGDRPLRKLFSKEQRAFYRDHAPAGVGLEDLEMLGPVFVLKLRFPAKELGRKLVAEFWLYPDVSRILELSTKCPPQDAFTAAAETRAFLAQRGVDISGEQQTKTRLALDFFSRRLAQGARIPA